MTEHDEFYEYGYRLDDEYADAHGVEMWEHDEGSDGSWISAHRALGISHVDINADADNVAAIERALQAAGVTGVVLRRRVTRTVHHSEEVQRVQAPPPPATTPWTTMPDDEPFNDESRGLQSIRDATGQFIAAVRPEHADAIVEAMNARHAEEDA